MLANESNTTDFGRSNSAQRKIADLTISEFISVLTKLQTAAIEEALMKVVPQTDPDENVYMTTKEAADMLGLSRQTIQEKKSKMLLEFYGQGRM